MNYMKMADEIYTRWTLDEKAYRSQVVEALAAGTPYAGMQAHAVQLSDCRKQLQKAFGLVERKL